MPRSIFTTSFRSVGPLDFFRYQAAFIPELYWSTNRVSARLNGPRMGQRLPPPPGVCCQSTQDGGVICSNGRGFPPN